MTIVNKYLEKLFYFLLILLFVAPLKISAIPSFSRQTNLPCSTCHYKFPELKPFGRLFKINGYTMTGIATIQSTYKNSTTLNLLKSLPISAMVLTSFAKTSKDVTGTQNNIIEFPQELGLFVAGEISPHIGAFIQLTYEDAEGSVGFDVGDVRYANHTTLGGKDLLYGVTLNSLPTMQDVWNTTSQWSFPYVGSEATPGPAAGTMLESELSVAGVGAYALFNNLIYAEVTGYRSVNQGGPIPIDASASGTINGLSPYWRLALQHQWGGQYLEVGTYGFYSKVFPSGISGLKDNYTDVAFDAQYENAFSNGSFIAHFNYIHEKQKLDATFNAGGSSNPEDNLNSLRFDAGFNFDAGYALNVGYFNTTGDVDKTIYAPAAVDGSATGSPNSNGFTLQATFYPWLNTQFGVQYVIYNKFNGSSNNYDGSGRAASDNNTLYVSTWLMF